ncbi:hypothetical protein [Vallitalea sp.]|jgi:hypothetical protein|uniref:hypothetical protein n=1 Tax=Vallitalea sp. TaxID=1882829 RepID=UPI0025CED138|nr:hypothetical protein [Vallitalea sp.]MCT4688516.1 hypothetical protein [Vallitalea sp.]
MVFKLDKDGNKIQRYDRAFFIDTDDKTNVKALRAGFFAAREDYVLTQSDCSDVPTAVLNEAKDTEGKKLENGEGIWAWNEMPNSKQSKIEKRNKGKDYASKIEPKTTQLQENEKGKNE